jgi:hypothetical protein
VKIKLHTVSRDKSLYYANAIYENGKVIVHKGSHINLAHGENFKSQGLFAELFCNNKLIDACGNVLEDIEFQSLSQAASFVTGRIANGMIVWKTDDNRYVRYSLTQSKEK